MAYKIRFYKTIRGKAPILDYIRMLENQSGKSSRIKLAKIQEYINVLRTYGKQVGEPYIKHLVGDIWELRPTDDRILFAGWDGNSFVLLHHFLKKSQKTPQKEIEQAKRNFEDYKKRYKD